MRHPLSFFLATLVGVLVAAPAHAWGEGRTKRKADEWIGRDASQLLLQLRVDGGRVEIEEDEATDETRYIFRTWDDAYYKTVVTGSDQHLVGVDRGTPIYQETVYTDQVFVPAQHRCTIVFTADAEGVIRHWRYEGDVCVQDIKRPKNRD